MDQKVNTNKMNLLHRNESTKRIIAHRPRLLAIMNGIRNEFASHKFTVYRCAAKLHALQKALHTDEVPYKLVLTVLERHCLHQSDETISVRQTQLTPVIHDILYACDKLGFFSQRKSFDLEGATCVLSTFFSEVFDPNNSTPFTLLEVKETFLLLCHVDSIDQLASEFFNLAADHNKCISRLRLESIMKILTKILSFIGEANAYGPHTISDIVEQCFIESPGVIGITEYQFNCLWNTNSNRFMIYSNLLALVKRIKDTESLIHTNACVSCLTKKIVGIRFKCYSCRDLSLCMKCFAIGFSSPKHSLNHRVYEVYGEDVPVKKWTHYLTKLCNVVFGRKPEQKPEEKKNEESEKSDNENEENHNMSFWTVEKENKSIQCQRNSYSIIEPTLSDRNVLEKLTTILTTLFEQKDKLENRRRNLNESRRASKSMADLLNDQHNIILMLIDQLKFILENNKQQSSLPISSTPNRLGCRSKITNTDTLSSPLAHSINGASINRSYLDANKSYYSISEMSTWFHNKHGHQTKPSQAHLHAIDETSMMDTEMENFRELLSKVKEIVDDSYSDNNDLAEATYHLETVLDSIIRSEEIKRQM